MRVRGLMTLVLAATLGLLVPAPAGFATGVPADPFAALGVERLADPSPAPDVRFRSIEGAEVRASDLRGKVVLLGLFTTW